MEIDLIFRIAAIGIIVAILNQVLKNIGREDVGLMVTIAGIVVVLMMIIPVLSGLFESVRSAFGMF